MRRVAILIGLLALFVCQANELLHTHELGETAQDCVACQAHSSPARECRAKLTLEPITHTLNAPPPLLPRPTLSLPLRVAPKTSPPPC